MPVTIPLSQQKGRRKTDPRSLPKIDTIIKVLYASFSFLLCVCLSLSISLSVCVCTCLWMCVCVCVCDLCVCVCVCVYLCVCVLLCTGARGGASRRGHCRV